MPNSDMAATLVGDSVRSGRSSDGERSNAVGGRVGSLQDPAALAAELASPQVGAAKAGTTSRRGFRNWARSHVRVMAICDAVIALASVIVVLAWGTTPIDVPVGEWLLFAGGAVAGWFVAIALAGGYRSSHVDHLTGEAMSVLRAAVWMVFAAAVLSVVMGDDRYLPEVTVAVGAAAAGGVLVRLFAHVAARVMRPTRRVRKVIVAGSRVGIGDFCTALTQDGNRVEVVGALLLAAGNERAAPEGAATTGEVGGGGQLPDLGVPVASDLDQLDVLISQSGCDAVVAGGRDAEFGTLRRLAWRLERSNVEFLVSPGLVEVLPHRLRIDSRHRSLPLLHVEHPRFKGWQRVFKRVFDLVLTCAGLLVASPVMVLIALIIKLEDPRAPIIFTQLRVGEDGRPFRMYKFRSMSPGAEQLVHELYSANAGAGPLFKLPDDPRVTRVGCFLRRYSLDELPQLFNVLAGTMSLVGPRPPLADEVRQYAPDEHRRLLVTPGLTGLWQVSGRSLLSWEDSIRLDLRYVENWSLGLDLKILARTVLAVISTRGAF